MSAEIIQITSHTQPSMPPNVTPITEAEPAPQPPAFGAADTVSRLLKNPLVIAGGAVVAGLLVTRIFGALPARRLVTEIVDEVLRHRRASGSIPAEAPAAAPAPAPASPAADVIQQGWEHVRPQVAGFAQKMLAQLAGKKQ